ncbi:MAG TPA: glucose 1-dehydrogenase [Acidimicrobiales bacterium]|nr:glucose 1-dehydrogenase [Acidimicrobiales bacterium]
MKPLSELLDLNGRTAIVTGGAAGIGLGIARRLAEAGAAVLVADIDGAAAGRAAKALGDDGFRAESAAADVSSPDGVARMVEAAVGLFGGLDIMVNNAGIYPNIPLARLEPDAFDHIVAVNLRGVYLCTRAASQTMKAQGRGGRIINVTSIDAVHPSMVGLATYDATKHGMWGFTKNVAIELAPFGIQVNAIAPGGILTPGAAAQAGSPVEGVDLDAMTKAFLARIPMGRMGDPDDIAKVVLFLASDMASYMTGSQVVVDGGALLA